MNSENTNILDSDEEDKLPLLKTALLNITKFTRPKKINIELQDDTTATNNNNDDFTPLAMFQRINHLVPGYYGMKRYMIMYEHLMKNTEWKLKDIKFKKFIEEVIIPELGVRFIMEDLGVDYDTTVTITRESVEYGNKYFFGDDNDECFWW
ncbi:32726_t:CDS:2 [Gigaspora margarita]|uniref:Restriction of telomere capping protein 4 n=1 Tax=Gigaspora margarita TaxID=4874 RepID=A0ABN7VC28_GIGMA|nr:32726_t:CDS:2 [Gigaspora margarita]